MTTDRRKMQEPIVARCFQPVRACTHALRAQLEKAIAQAKLRSRTVANAIAFRYAGAAVPARTGWKHRATRDRGQPASPRTLDISGEWRGGRSRRLGRCRAGG